MSKPILQKTSFGILRTNPKLTSNVKLIADSNDVLYLESFDANRELSKSKYKGYKVSSNGDYYFDLYRFYNQGSNIDNQTAFDLFERDNGLSIKERYGLQYDTTYGYGAKPKNSKIYPEEFSLLAPLWVEPTNIPDYFIICRLDDPVSINTKNSTSEANPILIDEITNPQNFVENVLNKSRIIAQFDMTEESNLGRYIRRHASNPLFPESAILADWNKDRFFRYNGINIKKPGFTTKTKDLFYDSWPNDKTIIEYENIITNGFSELGIVHSNIINLEFLFNDDNIDDYKFSRYYGFYVNRNEYNKFVLDGDALFEDRFNQTSQLPIPTQNNIGYATNTKTQIQTNENGIVVYAENPPISSIGGTSFFPNSIVKDMARIGYVYDAEGAFHKIKNDSNFNPGTLRLNDTSVDWKDFSGFQSPENYVTSEFNLNELGRPACVIEFVSKPINDDEFRVFFTDTNDLEGLPYIDNFTLTASDTLSSGTSSSNLYSTNGTLEKVAEAFANCFNDRNAYFPDLLSIRAISIGSKVVMFSRIKSSTWNKIKVTSFSNALTSDQTALRFVSGQLTDYTSTSYQSSPQPFTTVFGFLATGQFVGGNDNPKAKIKIPIDQTSLFEGNKYLVTESGFSKVLNVIPYLEEPIFDQLGQITGFNNFNNYYVVNISDVKQDISLNSSSKCSIVSLRENECGLFTIYPIKDFDFDFYNEQYNKDADSNVDKLIEFYTGATGPFGQTSSFGPGFTGTTGSTGWVDIILGPTSAFIQNGGYQRLAGIGDELTDTDSVVYNEYDRLKENEMKELALDSRVVPFINKWVYDDDGLDVRQNPYRLNADAAFRYSNFGPSFREFDPNTKFHTHEWYYLQKYPPYMDFEERVDSFSYFDEAINIGSTSTLGPTYSTFGLATVDGPTSEDLDYFTEYFTREYVGSTAVSTQIKYSTFAFGNTQRFPETLFRGAKVVLKQRFDNTPINFDINKKRYRKGTKYNGYKFASCISLVESGLKFKVIENERYRTITMVIEAGLRDNYFTKFGDAPLDSTDPNDYFLDRSIVYTLQDRLKLDSGNFVYDDFVLSGAINHWEGSPGNVILYGGFNYANETNPNFIAEMQQQEDGSYNDVVFQNPLNPGLVWVATGIKSVSINQIIATNLQEFVAPYTPGDSPTSTNLLAFPFIPFTGFPTVFNETALWSISPTYLGGGYRGYVGIIDDLSFANIADKFNTGFPDIEYITYKTDGTVVTNDKVLELSIPNEQVKANYLIPIEDTNVPNELDSIISGDIAGYVMSASQRANINVLSRYDGRYQPKFNDILFFKDYYESGPSATQGPRYYGFDKYRNLEFNLDESDFGLIKNYFYNKVNPENPKGVLSLSNTNLPSVYPKIGEIAINRRDLYTFLSNWDMDFYRKSTGRTTFDSIIGYRGTIENKAFFGSKIISIPDEIRLENFTLIELADVPNGLDGIDDITESVVEEIIDTSTPRPRSGSVNRTLKQELNLNVFVTKALTQFLRSDGFDSEFNKYINPNFDFGEAGLDDDINSYIESNVFQRYVVKQIIFYEKRFGNNTEDLDTVVLDLSNFDLLKKGYQISKNLQVKFSETSPLNFKLIYNIPKLENYSISFKVDLEKK